MENASSDGGTLRIGRCTRVCVGARVTATSIGPCNVFDVKCVVSGPGLPTATGCCFGALGLSAVLCYHHHHRRRRCCHGRSRAARESRRHHLCLPLGVCVCFRGCVCIVNVGGALHAHTPSMPSSRIASLVLLLFLGRRWGNGRCGGRGPVHRPRVLPAAHRG